MAGRATSFDRGSSPRHPDGSMHALELGVAVISLLAAVVLAVVR